MKGSHCSLKVSIVNLRLNMELCKISIINENLQAMGFQLKSLLSITNITIINHTKIFILNYLQTVRFNF